MCRAIRQRSRLTPLRHARHGLRNASGRPVPPPGRLALLTGAGIRRLIVNDAGWSSLVARRAHNPKVVGSNPTPATNHDPLGRGGRACGRRRRISGRLAVEKVGSPPADMNRTRGTLFVIWLATSVVAAAVALFAYRSLIRVSDLAGRTDPAVIWDDPTVLFTDPGLLGTAVEMRVTESVRACMEARGQTFRGPAVVESISSLLDPPRDGYGIAAGSDTPGRPSAAVALRRGIGSPMRPPCTGRHSIPLPRASGAVLPWALTPWRRP